MSQCQGFDATRLGFAFPDEQQLLKLNRRLHKGFLTSQDSDGGASGTTSHRSRPRVGFYKGNVVFIKPIYKKNVDLTRSIRKELIEVPGGISRFRRHFFCHDAIFAPQRLVTVRDV